MPAKTFCATLNGLDARVIEVEVNVSSGLPTVALVGLVDTSIRESKERVRACLKNSRFEFPLARVTINLAPGNVFKYGTHFDLSIALAILRASGQIYFETNQRMFLGELSLDGLVRPVTGALAMALAAKDAGFTEVYLPLANCVEASLVEGIGLIGCNSFDQVLSFILGKANPEFYAGEKILGRPQILDSSAVDFSEIIGQSFAKRGMEIAAAGGHNILLKGPPGSGKTLLARAATEIIPKPNQEKFFEIAKIYSAAGFAADKISVKPFRSPSVSITLSSFIGGGRIPKPGEISLAHNGILFLDEFSEFPRALIESLRDPLESGQIQVARMQGQYLFPADFILIAATNPCPCGFYGDQDGKCICSRGRILAYQRKISGPILDRIDLQINVERADLFAPKLRAGESSAAIAARVATAREVQFNRNGALNNKLSRSALEKFCKLSLESSELLRLAHAKYNFSARAYHRILRVARTIADLAGEEQLLIEHLAESLQYRLPE